MYLQGSKNEVPINKESFLINDQDQINPGPFFDPCKENETPESEVLLIHTYKYFEFYQLNVNQTNFIQQMN